MKSISIPNYIPYIATNQKKYVDDCLSKNMISWRGEYVGRFESVLEDYLNVKHVITTSNGTVSLFMILKTLIQEKRIAPQSYIIVPSLTYAATVAQIKLAGCIPIYTNSISTLQLNISEVYEHLYNNCNMSTHPRNIALMVPQLYADAPDMYALLEICKKFDVPLIEDSAEVFGCTYQNDRKLGTFGIASSFSFFANKVITTGEGGCVCTNNSDLAEAFRSFKNQNHIGGYAHRYPGSNFRMTNIQAAIGLAQLEDIDIIINKKRHIADVYRENLPKEYVRIVPNIQKSSEWMPVFRLPEGKTYSQANEFFNVVGIETRPVFQPCHSMIGFEGLFIDSSHIYYNMDIANKAHCRHIIFPCYPAISEAELFYITKRAYEFVKN